MDGHFIVYILCVVYIDYFLCRIYSEVGQSLCRSSKQSALREFTAVVDVYQAGKFYSLYFEMRPRQS